MKTLPSLKHLEDLANKLARKDAEKARHEFRRAMRQGKYVVQHLAMTSEGTTSRNQHKGV